MKTDKNTIIGLALLGILFIGYFVITGKQKDAYEKSQQHIKDSIALVKQAQAKPIDSLAYLNDSLSADSLARVNTAGNFLGAANGSEQLQVIENDLMKITFSNKGGQIRQVELKNYLSFDS